MTWIKDSPKVDHKWYWWRPDGGTNDDASVVFVRFDSSDFQFACNKGEWSSCPIQFPDDKHEDGFCGPECSRRNH